MQLTQAFKILKLQLIKHKDYKYLYNFVSNLIENINVI